MNHPTKSSFIITFIFALALGIIASPPATTWRLEVSPRWMPGC